MMDDMIVVIIAGGSGTRLWPLSTPEYPKHLLKLIGEESLLQSAYHRAKKISDDIYVVTEVSHAHHVKEQLPDLKDDAFIIEAGRRGTAGCIIAGLHHVQSRHDNNEPVAFLHADHVIRDVEGFAFSFKVAGEVAALKNKITLIGIEPTYPSTGFGYIHKDAQIEGHDLVFSVRGFKEKPEFDIAQEYFRSGEYLWNCGYFVGSVNTFAEAFKKFSPQWFTYYQQLLGTKDDAEYKEVYLSFENNAIDYALMERDKELLVVPAHFDWMDLGSYIDVHSAVETDEIGNHVHGDKIALEMVENSLVRNDEAKPVAVVGLDNVIVVNTPHGLLVARKDLSQKVGDIAKKIQAQHH